MTFLVAGAILIPAIGVQAGSAVRPEPGMSRQQQDPLLFARRLYNDGLYDIAANQLRQLLETNLPLQYAEEARWLLAETLEADGRTAEAAGAYREFTSRHGSAARAPEGWLRTGRLFLSAAEYEASADAYSNFLDLFPVNDQRPQASAGLIEALLTDLQYQDALTRVMEAYAEYPFHPLKARFLLQEAEARNGLGEPWMAIPLAEEALASALTPEVRADAAALKARLLIEDGRIDEAVDAARTAIEAPAPAERIPYLKSVLGQALVASGRQQEALPELREAISGSGGRVRASAALWLARAHVATGEIDSALAAFDLNLAGTSEDQAATVALEAARIAVEHGQRGRALTLADLARREAVTADLIGDAVALSAEVLVGLDRSPEAIERYRAFFEQDDLSEGTRAAAALELGRLYEHQLSDPDTAAGWYRMAAVSAGTGDIWAEGVWSSANAIAASGDYSSAIIELIPLAGAGGDRATQATDRIDYWRTYRLVDLAAGLRSIQGAMLALASEGSSGATGALLEIARANVHALKDFETAIDAYDRYLQRIPSGPTAATAWLEKGQAFEALAIIAATETGEEAATAPRERAGEAYREAVRTGGESEASERAQLALIELDLAELRDDPVLYFQAMRDRYRAFLDLFTASDRLNDVLFRLGEANEGLGRATDASYFDEAASVFALLLEEEKPPEVVRRARVGMGRNLYLAGRYDEALGFLEAALTDLPPDAAHDEILFMTGDTCLRTDDNRNAILHFRELETRYPESEWTALSSEVMGTLLMEEGLIEEAITTFRRFLEQDRGRASWRLAAALAENDEWDESLDHLAAAGSDPRLDHETRIAIRVLEARAAHNSGRTERELAAYRALWNEAPESPEALEIAERFGMMLTDHGEFNQADTVWSAIAATTNSDSLLVRAEAELVYLAYAGGRVMTATERKDTFEEKYRRERAVLNRYRPLFWSVEGQMWLQREEWDRAEGIFQEILDEAPDSPYVPVALYGVGISAMQREEPERAIPLFQDLIVRFPDDPQTNRARLRLGIYADTNADYATAIPLYQAAATDDDPVTAKSAQYNLVGVLERMRMYESAQQEALTYLQRYPDSEDIFNMKMKLGGLYVQDGQLGRAVQYYRNLQGSNSEEEARLRWQLAEALFSLARYDDAVVEYMKLAILNEDQFLYVVTARLKAADSYAHLGDRDTALELYRQIIVRYGADSDYGRVAQLHLENVQAGRSPGALPPQPPPR